MPDTEGARENILWSRGFLSKEQLESGVELPTLFAEILPKVKEKTVCNIVAGPEATKKRYMVS